MVGSGWNGAPNGKAGLVRIARLDDLRVEVDVHQSDISTIRLDDSAIATLAGTPPRSFACRVLRVDPQANRQQGTIRVELLVISPDSALTPNANVSVVFSRR
jgi:multidrug efflux pump subunit AcrA (membrane-fusion protein)